MLSTYADKWTPEILPWVAIISGIFSIIVIGLGLQRYMLFMPKSVFEGFTTAVGLIIGLKQINNALGLRGLTKVATIPAFFLGVSPLYSDSGQRDCSLVCC
jgi:MFS superfamily sulfate permease-like transporter